MNQVPGIPKQAVPAFSPAQPAPLQIKWPTPGNVITTKAGMQYTIGNQFAQGGFALVFEGLDVFGNAVALKVYKPANRPFDQVRAQWEQECRLFEKLRHPNVVAIYDAFICDNLFYIVLERAWGRLCDYVDQFKPLPETLIREIARQLLFAVNYIHAHGVLHRDITIYNAFVFEGPASKGPVFKISDFGISKEFIDPWQDKICHTHIAHPCFIPPELIDPKGYSTERSDLYHLGLILLYALTGSLPFDETMPKDQIAKLIQDGVPRRQAEALGTPIGQFIAVLLRRRDEYRYKNALEAWNALRNTPAPMPQLPPQK
jgi:serine/threonine-protein kinase